MPKKTKKKAVELLKEKRNLRYQFTKEELLEQGKQLAEITSRITQLEEDKKRVVSDFSAKLNAASAESSVISNKITSGYELRLIDCVAYLNTPRAGFKQILRVDTREQVAVEEMTQEDSQRLLLIEESDKAEKEKALEDAFRHEKNPNP